MKNLRLIKNILAFTALMCLAYSQFVINDFNTPESATDEGDGAFWVEANESESPQNYSTLVQIPANQAPESDSPVMSYLWGTVGDLGWGGYTSVYHVYETPVDISDNNYLSFKFYNLTQPANLGSVSFRVNLFDVSDATTWETRDDTEVWFSFFEGEGNSPFYNAADDGWVEYRIPLVGGTTIGPYQNGFVLTHSMWSIGIAGNGTLDLDQIGGLSIEVVQVGTVPNAGEFLLEDIQAIYSVDVPGCMDPTACNYNPDATIDDGSCYFCVDATFNLDMSSIPSYTESDIPYLAGGLFFGGPGNPDFALSYNSDLSGDGALIFSRTVQMRENSYFNYTYTSDENPSWGTKESIVGQDCAVGQWSDREMTTSTNDTTINACFANCTDNEFCPEFSFNLIDVTFTVNMQNEQVDESGVFLHGNWFAWGTMAMSDDNSDGVYEITIPEMTEGSTIEFKFMNGTVAEDVPADCEYINNYGDGINRMYTLPAINTIIGPICFGECSDCVDAHPVDVTFNVDMSGVDGFDGTEVPYVFGSFNNWDYFSSQTMLADVDGDNVYTGTVNDLMSDQEHTFLFGYSTNYEQNVPEECGILFPDLGSNVRLLPIQDAGSSEVLVLDAIPYGGCPEDDPASSAMFAVDVSTVVSTFPEGYTVWASGTFDSWSGWGVALTDDDGDMVYTGIQSDLVAGTAYEYQFVINGWSSGIVAGAPLGSACDFDPNDVYANYGFTAVEGLFVLGEVCWGACVTCDLLSNSDITVDYQSDWNLVGLPADVEDPYYLSIFPDAIENTLYSFDITYNPANMLVPGDGYWLMFQEAGTATIVGTPINELTINLDAGWNFISGIAETVSIYSVIDPDSIIIPGTLYGFNGAYIVSDMFFPGRGYWLKTFEAGEITLTSGALAKVKPYNFSLKGMANSLSINDTELYFGIELSDKDMLSYSLPPKPPIGAFDIRFKGDTRIAMHKAEIEVMNPYQTITISYDVVIDAGEHMNWILISESGSEYTLKGTGEITVPTEETFTLERKAIIPIVYTLHQNYPNPFNPITSLRYDLPEQAQVTLTIYNLMGKEITQLVNTTQEAGYRSVQWNATDLHGKPVSAGVYLYQIRAGEFVQTKKMVLLK